MAPRQECLRLSQSGSKFCSMRFLQFLLQVVACARMLQLKGQIRLRLGGDGRLCNEQTYSMPDRQVGIIKARTNLRKAPVLSAHNSFACRRKRSFMSQLEEYP